MPIAQPDRAKGPIANDLERGVRAEGTALGAADDKLVALDCDGGYSVHVDGLSRGVLGRVAMRLRAVLGGAVLDGVLGVRDAVDIAVLRDVCGMVALLDMVLVHDMVLRRIAQD